MTSTIPQKEEKAKAKGPRWWPLWALFLAALAALMVIWRFLDLSGQDRVIFTMAAVGSSAILVWIWALLFSRLRWATRFLVAFPMLLAVAASAACLRVGGVTGNLVPILAWRWAPRAPPELSSAEGDGSLLVKVAAGLTLPADRDYPQFLGPERNGVVRGLRLARDWEARPPKLLWRHPVGAGWSSFAVVGGYAVTQEQRGESEMVVCYALESGEEAWRHGDRAHYSEVIAGEGPRATPTVAGGRVYAVGATGILNCLEGPTGRPLWMKDILKDNEARNNHWGKSCSPLLVDGLVIVSAGGENGKSLVAYRADTGERAWSGGSQHSNYSSPFLATLAGRRQIVMFNGSSVAAHDPLNGQVLWWYPWPGQEPTVSQPVAMGSGELLVSSGYGVGSTLLKVQGESNGGLVAGLLWKTSQLKSKFANMVVRNGFVYGLDDGILACLDLEDGKRRWKGGRYGHGQLILVEGLLLVQAESGEVVLVEASPEAHWELGRFQAIEGKTWNHPALSGRYLLVRNSQEAACYEMALEE